MEPIWIYHLSREEKIKIISKELSEFGSVDATSILSRNQKFLDKVCGIANGPTFEIGEKYFELGKVRDPKLNRRDIILHIHIHKSSFGLYLNCTFIDLKNELRNLKLNGLINV